MNKICAAPANLLWTFSFRSNSLPSKGIPRNFMEGMAVENQKVSYTLFKALGSLFQLLFQYRHTRRVFPCP